MRHQFRASSFFHRRAMMSSNRFAVVWSVLAISASVRWVFAGPDPPLCAFGRPDGARIADRYRRAPRATTDDAHPTR